MVEELRKRNIGRLPEDYNLLDLSPRSKIMGQRRERALKNHRTEVMRNSERCARNLRVDAVAKIIRATDREKKLKAGSGER